jgi:transposase
VQRAQIIWRARRGETASAIVARVGLDSETGRKRIRRFNAEGLEALKDRHRSGRPLTYSAEQTATVTATALTKPQTLGLPFTSWTFNRLATYLHEAKGIAMQRSRIDEILLREGLRWRKHKAWIRRTIEWAYDPPRCRNSPVPHRRPRTKPILNQPLAVSNKIAQQPLRPLCPQHVPKCARLQ